MYHGTHGKDKRSCPKCCPKSNAQKANCAARQRKHHASHEGKRWKDKLAKAKAEGVALKGGKHDIVKGRAYTLGYGPYSGQVLTWNGVRFRCEHGLNLGRCRRCVNKTNLSSSRTSWIIMLFSKCCSCMRCATRSNLSNGSKDACHRRCVNKRAQKRGRKDDTQTEKDKGSKKKRGKKK